jgi:hypothetical protein
MHGSVEGVLGDWHSYSDWLSRRGIAAGTPVTLCSAHVSSQVSGFGRREPHVTRFFKLTRVHDLGPAVAKALALVYSGVPGPVFIESLVALLYDQECRGAHRAAAAPAGRQPGKLPAASSGTGRDEVRLGVSSIEGQLDRQV